MKIRDYVVEKVEFNEDDRETASSEANKIKMNPGGANGLKRDPDTILRNKIMGFLAEEAVLRVLRKELGSLIHKKATPISNQVDLFCGTKTIEVRSSKVPSLEDALFRKRGEDSVWHLVGDYTTKYKKTEQVKDWYIWVIFEDSLEYCYIVGGADKGMIKGAPEVTMIPKGVSCKNPTKYHALRPDQIYQFDVLLTKLRPSVNERLSLAKKNKEDEFYTLYSTVEKELSHYWQYLRGKKIYCPCDTEASSFWQYFVNHKEIGYQSVTATSLTGDKLCFDGDRVTKSEVANGSYDSEECLKILEESDIVITNPPFSKFRDFVSKIKDKDFLIIGNQNVSCTKDIFPLFRDSRVRYGYGSGSEKFRIPAEYETRSKNVTTDKEGNRYVTVEGIRWFTTLPVEKRTLTLSNISPFVLPRYDNYRAFEISRVKDIPLWRGTFGVPISYLNYHDPERFILVGTSGELAGPIEENGKIREKPGRFYLNGERLYERIVITRRN